MLTPYQYNTLLGCSGDYFSKEFTNTGEWGNAMHTLISRQLVYIAHEMKKIERHGLMKVAVWRPTPAGWTLLKKMQEQALC